MEAKIFPRPAVAAALERYVEARLHLDAAGAKYLEKQQKMVGTLARPTYVIVDPRTEEILTTQQGWLPGNGGDDFAAWLNSARR